MILVCVKRGFTVNDGRSPGKVGFNSTDWPMESMGFSGKYGLIVHIGESILSKEFNKVIF